MYFEGKKLLSTITEFAKQNSEQDDIHGFPHIIRVYDLCQEFGEKLNANLKILLTAALLHDIGRKNEETTQNHAEISAEIARDYISSLGDNYSNIEIEQILHCIRAHSFSNNIPPNTLEAKILSDVDKLDALGAIGLYRTIGFTVKNKGGIEQVLNHLRKKIMNLHDKMHLKETRRLAKKRIQIIHEFYNKISIEIK